MTVVDVKELKVVYKGGLTSATSQMVYDSPFLAFCQSQEDRDDIRDALSALDEGLKLGFKSHAQFKADRGL